MIERPDGSSREGLMYIPTGSNDLETLARAGEPVPDGSGAVFANFSTPAAGVQWDNWDKNWRAVFAAELAGNGVTAGNDRGVFVVGSDNSIHRLLREGDPITLAAGDTRTVESFVFTPWSLNALDQVSLSLLFTDGTSVVVIADLVEPPPGPTPPTPATPITLTLKGFPKGPIACKTVKTATLVVTGTTTGNARRIEWRRTGESAIRSMPASRQWKLRLPLKPGKNRFAIRAVDSRKEATAWKQVVIKRKSRSR